MTNVEQEASRLDREIGARLRSARRACRMSQTALGEVIGVTIQQVQRYEVGENRLSAAALIRVARALDLSPLDLLGPPADGETPGDHALLVDDHAEALLRAYKDIASPTLRRIVRELAVSLMESQSREAGETPEA